MSEFITIYVACWFATCIYLICHQRDWLNHPVRLVVRAFFWWLLLGATIVIGILQIIIWIAEWKEKRHG